MTESEIGIFEAKTRLSEYLERVRGGERFFITRRGKRIAELIPVEPEKKRLARGMGRDTIEHIADDFDAPLEDLEEYM